MGDLVKFAVRSACVTALKVKPGRVERAAGIEPAWPAWKAGTLPLSYTRKLRGSYSTTLALSILARVSCGAHEFTSPGRRSRDRSGQSTRCHRRYSDFGGQSGRRGPRRSQ